jgi:hypothetical protein
MVDRRAASLCRLFNPLSKPPTLRFLGLRIALIPEHNAGKTEDPLRQQTSISCLGLLGLRVWLMPTISPAAPPQQTGAGEKNQPLPLPAAKEELLGELPPEARLAGLFGPSAFFLSPDGRRFAAHVKTNKNKWVVVIDGKPGPEFEEVRFQDRSRLPGVEAVVFSPNSQHAAYAGHTGSGEKGWVVVLDGKAGPEFDEVLVFGRLQFSPDSEHLAYRAIRAGRWFMVVDGKEGSVFQEEVGNPLFSPDSQHLAYRAKREGKWLMVVDGMEGPQFREMRDPMFSSDSQHVAYRAQKDRDKWMIVVDGQPGPEFAYIDQGWTFSPDGKHLAYKARTGSNKWVIVLDGQPGPEFENIAKGPFFSPDGSRLSYEVLQGPKNLIVVDAKPGPEFDAVPSTIGKSTFFHSSVGAFGFSPNGQHLSYMARRGQKFVVTQDGQTGPEFPFILAGPVFSTDSQHAAYAGWERDAISMVLDGKITKKISVPEGKPLYTQSGRQTAVDRETAWDSAGEVFAPLVPLWPVFFAGELFATAAAKSVNFVEHITFSPNGQRLAYIVGRGGHIFDGKEHSRAQRRVVLDGQEGRQYDAEALFNLTFSSDSSHFAFEVHNADKGKSFVVLDGQEGKPYDELLTNKMGWWQPWVQGTLRFQDDNSVTYLAREGRKFYRVTQQLR